METCALLIPIILLFIDKNKTNIKQKKNISFLLIVVFLFLFMYSTFREYFLPRDMIGADYYSYQFWFDNLYKIKTINNIGFNLLILFVKLFSEKYVIFLAVVSLIMLFNFFKFAIDNSSDYRYSIFIFITFGLLSLTFNGIRQSLACSIWLLGFKYLSQDKGFIKYCLFTFLATLIHSSAIALIILYPIMKTNCKLRYRILVLVVLAVIFKSDFVIRYILNKFSTIDNTYLHRYYGTKNISQSNLVVFGIAIIVLIATLINIKKYDINQKSRNVKINYLLLTAFVGFIAPYHLIYSRMLFYFMPSIMLSVPEVFLLYDKDLSMIIKYFATVLFLTMYFV